VAAFDALGFGVEDEDALDEVAELADVARPVVLAKRGEGVVGEVDVLAAVLLAELDEELFYERGDVFLAVAEGRDEEGDDVEAVEEVFAEVAVGDLFFEVLVGGGDDADVDVDGVGGADGKEALFVEGTEDLGLGFEAHVADLIEEEGAAVGALEGASFFGRSRGAGGAGSVAVAEELGVDVVLGDGGAVELDEGAVGAEGFGVHGAADEFLAGSTFAEDKDAAVGGGHELDLLAEGFDGDAGASDGGLGGELAVELGVVLAEAAGLHGVAEDDEGAVEGEGFFEEVVGAELGGADGGFDRAVAGDDDDLGDLFGGELADVGEGVEAVAIGEPDIQKNHIM